MKAATPFSELLRTARHRRGWTQQELATKCGLSIPSVHSYERGSIPGIVSMCKLVKVLGLNWTNVLECSFGDDGRKKRVRV